MVSPMLFIIAPLGAAFLMTSINRREIALVLSLLTAAGLGLLGFSWLPATLELAQPVVAAAIRGPMGIALSLDALGTALAIIVALSTTLVLLYSSSYLPKGHHEVRYYAVVMLLMASSFGLVLARDVFNLFVFFEILCISSYILVSWEQTGAALEASFKYMVLGSIGSIFILVSIALSYHVAGSLAMADIAQAFRTAPKAYGIMAAVLFLFGFGVEAAIFPVNTWLPDAHSSAPSSISALLSGFVIELALLVVFRVQNTVFATVDMLPVLQVLGISGVIVGEFAAFGQKDLKRMLAYSSISQVGIMLFAISLGTTAGAQAGVYHVIMHAGAKSALFLIAGYFILRTGRRLVEDYRGLGQRMPVSAALFGLAALSLLGAPPLFGFFTKFMILSAAASAGGGLAWFGIAAILLGTVLEALYLFRVIRTLFAPGDTVAPGGRVVRAEMDLPALVAVAVFTALVVFGALLLPALSSMIGPIANGLVTLH